MSIFNKTTNETKNGKQTKSTASKTGWNREQLLAIKDSGYTGSLLHDTVPEVELESLGYEREF